jgi:hypothetical protein
MSHSIARCHGLIPVCPSLLVAEGYLGSSLALFEDDGLPVAGEGTERRKHINSETWEPLEKLHKGEGWPRSDAYVQKKYDDMKDAHHAWPDR